MSFKPTTPSSPTTDIDIPNTDPYNNVAYSDIVEDSIYYEEEVSTIVDARSILFFY